MAQFRAASRRGLKALVPLEATARHNGEDEMESDIQKLGKQALAMFEEEARVHRWMAEQTEEFRLVRADQAPTWGDCESARRAFYKLGYDIVAAMAKAKAA